MPATPKMSETKPSNPFRVEGFKNQSRNDAPVYFALRKALMPHEGREL